MVCLAQYVVKTQAQIRGVLRRRRFARLKVALQSSRVLFVKLQSSARAKIARQNVSEASKTFAKVNISISNVSVTISEQLRKLDLVRRRIQTQLAKLDDVSSTIIRIQAAARTYSARKRLLNFIRGLRRATPTLIAVFNPALVPVLPASNTRTSTKRSPRSKLFSP
ncbi:hypothetical protein JVT61DRAFT_15592 [Boletus reticuloceps]|uniref:Uncharacterized protein n=1 Tax=Boletus reticuloceps TaxID=495285 RepID=A0A8I2YC61_9AGAM|nr:hypothetical protein JVT61DRAFT_15592 [Boletus reticuloceps]